MHMQIYVNNSNVNLWYWLWSCEKEGYLAHYQLLTLNKKKHAYFIILTKFYFKLGRRNNLLNWYMFLDNLILILKFTLFVLPPLPNYHSICVYTPKLPLCVEWVHVSYLDVKIDGICHIWVTPALKHFLVTNLPWIDIWLYLLSTISSLSILQWVSISWREILVDARLPPCCECKEWLLGNSILSTRPPPVVCIVQGWDFWS